MPQEIYISPNFSGFDSFLDSSNANTAYDLDAGENQELKFSSTRDIVVQFPLRKIPYHFTPTDARIGFFMKSGSVTVDVHRVLREWDSNVTYNSRLSGTPWVAPGGDYDPTPILSGVTLSGTNAWSYFGTGNSDFLQLIQNWLSEFYANYGLILLVTSGSATCYAMNDDGTSYADQSDTSLPEDERDTKYHPELKLTGDIDHNPTAGILTSNILAVEERARRWTLFCPDTNNTLPITLANGVPYLGNPQVVTDLIESWQYTRARSQLGTDISLTVRREKSEDLETPSASRHFWYPMEIVQLEERLFAKDQILSYSQGIYAVIDGDQEAYELDVSSISINARDPAIYGLISVYQGQLKAVQIPVPAPPDPFGPGITLTKVDSGANYWIFYYVNPATLEQARNWASDPPPIIWTFSDGDKVFWETNQQIFVHHGFGELWVEKEFFEASIDEGGMGNPSNVYATFVRWANPFDSLFDSMPINYAIYLILKDAGYQRIENSGYLHIKNLPPVLGDFVFDQVVHNPAVGADVDLTNSIQNESGATLVDTGPVLANDDDALYFKLNVKNGRFKWIYYIPHTGVDATTPGTLVWEIFVVGDTWQQITPFKGIHPISGDRDPYSWLRGTTDDGADTLVNTGLITFHEDELVNWKATTVTFDAGASTGFFMRVRVDNNDPPSPAPHIHRWAAKEVMRLGQDKESSEFTWYDENSHWELIESINQRWGIPNYYVYVDRFGDVEAKYIIHQFDDSAENKGANYALTTLDRLERIRDSKNVYTEVRVRVNEVSNENIIDWARKSNGGEGFHDSFVVTNEDSVPYNTSDAIASGTLDNDPFLAFGIDNIGVSRALGLPIDGNDKSFFLLSSYRLRDLFGSGVGTFNLPENFVNQVFYRVQFSQTITVTNVKVISSMFHKGWDIQGYFPDDAEWRSLIPPGTFVRTDTKDPQARHTWEHDFTIDADPFRPTVNAVRIVFSHLVSLGTENQASLNSSYFLFYLHTLSVLGYSAGDALEGVAILGTTPPFDTPADQALMKRYRRRVFAVEANPFITTKEEADRAALNILRELYRLYDPLEVRGIYPLLEIGDTVYTAYDPLAIDTTYVVEEVDREPLMEYDARLVPYRFSALTDPPLVTIPNRTNLQGALPPECLPFMVPGGGGTIPLLNLVMWFMADTDLQTFSDGGAVVTWKDERGQASLVDEPLISLWHATGGPDSKPYVELLDGSDLGRTDHRSQPIHIFMVMKIFSGGWANNNSIWHSVDGIKETEFYMSGSSPTLRMRAPIGGPSSGNLPVDTWGLAELVFNGTQSSISLVEESAIVADAGTNGLGTFRLGNGPSAGNPVYHIGISEIMGYIEAKTGDERGSVINYLKTKYSI
jgi:hypothetical protein